MKLVKFGLLALTLTFLNCSRTIENGGQTGPIPQDVALAACGLVSHGNEEMRIMFESASVPFGQQCVTEVQKRTCNDGILGEWSGTFESESCSPLAPVACAGNVPHGELATRIRYERSNVGFNQVCNFEIQTARCNNGAVGAFTGTFAFDTCQVANGAACGNTPHGGVEVRTRYQAAVAPVGQDCNAEFQIRVCNDGTFGNFSGTFTELACTPAPCGNVPHNGQQSRVGWILDGRGNCLAGIDSRTCSKGVFGPWSTNYPFDSCEAAMEM